MATLWSAKIISSLCLAHIKQIGAPPAPTTHQLGTYAAS
jgi:hypothetical protein